MALIVNGEPRPFREGQTVLELLQELRFSFPLKTVFQNGQPVPKADEARTILQDGDRIDVVHMMSGG